MPEIAERSGRLFFPRLVVATWTQRYPDAPWVRPRTVLVRGVLKGAKGQPLKTEGRATLDVGGIGHGRWPTWVHELINDFDPDKEINA